MRKFARLLSLSLVICLLSSILVFGEVFASTETSTQTFKDVELDASYYEAVEYLVDEGVIKGCGNGLFNPEENITLKHFAIMLIRAFGDIEKESTPLPVCYKNGWITMYAVSRDPNSDISRGNAYQSICTVNGVSVFASEKKYIDWKDYANTIENLVGFKNKDLSLGITRGEVAELFYYFLTNDVNDIEVEYPEVIDGIVFENDSQNIGEYVQTFYKIPPVLLEKFKEAGWKIDLTNRNFLKYSEETGASANGLCWYNEKTISLKTPASLIHEFGHFLDYISDFDLGIPELYSAEGVAFEKYNGRDLRNSREYFAEYFELYILAKESDKKLEFLKELTPITFEYFKNLEENDWVLNK